jgi:hypothetical protein
MYLYVENGTEDPETTPPLCRAAIAAAQDPQVTTPADAAMQTTHLPFRPLSDCSSELRYPLPFLLARARTDQPQYPSGPAAL